MAVHYKNISISSAFSNPPIVSRKTMNHINKHSINKILFPIVLESFPTQRGRTESTESQERTGYYRASRQAPLRNATRPEYDTGFVKNIEIIPFRPVAVMKFFSFARLCFRQHGPFDIKKWIEYKQHRGGKERGVSVCRSLFVFFLLWRY